jgi:hydroxymethylglutaryl-CoA reductase
MAIEESSVVAASKSAKFWSTRGGFKATVINTEKMDKFTLCTLETLLN